MRLLVIEDEDRLSGILKSKLGDIGFTVDIAGSAADASAALELINYDAAILDLGLPDGDGLTVLTATRQAGKGLPILILTARDAVEDRVAGLNAGADDYLTKPFAIAELIARIKALLRRPGGVLGMTLEAGNVRLDTVGRELTIGGIPARLSRRELAILEQMRHLSRVSRKHRDLLLHARQGPVQRRSLLRRFDDRMWHGAAHRPRRAICPHRRRPPTWR